MSGKRMLIAGVTGGIGSAVREEAERSGWHVVASLDDEAAHSLDAFVFAVGRCKVMPLSDLTDDVFSEMLKVNCTMFVSMMRKIVAERRYSLSGMRAVVISSVSAVEGWAGGAAYCASKGALSAVCRALHAELKSRRISVKALEPRYVRTRMFYEGAAKMGVPESEAMLPEKFAQQVLQEMEKADESY